MRLKHIHLAGFKSFVDPVTIPARAALTGVVGPNGCGKSNVIDAVRWVLGESKARDLRGETLQDVIFSGSAGRKPAGRAVVELLFDNGDGRAPGPWAAYAELSVKRILTRSGESTYHINNVHVRRRDVTDLILGTGLGGDAYAIIEQGTISRLIEAKPDELRGHLEEAAGVSKYRERRRETENRLRDTRDNLDRIEDIRIELASQLDKLAAQAEVAQRFAGLNAEKDAGEARLAFLRRRDALAQEARLARDLQQAELDLEARVAEQRQAERQMEDERLRQQEGMGALDRRQAAYYAAGAEVTRQEQALRVQREERQRLENGRQQDGERLAQRLQARASLAAERTQMGEALTQARAGAEQRTAEAAALQARLPEAEQALQTAQAAQAQVQRVVSEHAQAEAVGRNALEQARRLLGQLEPRQQRLREELANIPQVSESELARLEEAHAAAQTRLGSLESALTAARSAAESAESEWHGRLEARNQDERNLHRCEAALDALKRVQAAQQADGDEPWLAERGLDGAGRLWQTLEVEAGWERALEAVLGPALAAFDREYRRDWLSALPAASFDWPFPGRPAPVGDRPAQIPGARPLRDCVRTRQPLFDGLLDEALWQVWAVPDLAQALAGREQLPPGARLVTPEGHQAQRHRLHLQGSAPEGEGSVLVRQREIGILETQRQEWQTALAAAEAALAEAEAARRAARQAVEAAQGQVREAQSQQHQAQIESMQLREKARQAGLRHERIARELTEVEAEIDTERRAAAAGEAHLARLGETLKAVRTEAETARLAMAERDVEVIRLRSAERAATQAAQQAAMELHSLETRLAALAEREVRDAEEITRIEARIAEAAQRLENLTDGSLQAALDAALGVRQAAEAELTLAREAVETAQAAVQAFDAARIAAERAQEPLRARIQTLALKRQEAALKAAQHGEALAGQDLEALAATLAKGSNESGLLAEIQAIAEAIAALGAVNLAALEELQAAQARKAYLDAQAADLEAAIATLTEAIERIDAESRASLKRVYERVSEEFRSLFVELFGGGEAQLVLTGDDILSAGLSIVAQPPGKKNTSIHLLSGGEKALTALSLVFALFRLNPAPFCLLDEVDAPLDDTNTERYTALVKKMSAETQFLFITHNRITMEMAEHLVGVTMPEPGVSRPVAVDVADALRLAEAA